MSILSFIKRVCVQPAIYWGNPVDDGMGTKTYDEPIEIKCRWEYKTKVIQNYLGEEVISTGQILTPEELSEKGFLYLGSLTDFDAFTDILNPLNVNGSYEIIAKDKIPLIFSTTKFVKTYYF